MLAFGVHTQKYFDFLITAYGITCVSANDHLVRYESQKIFVNIRYDNGRSFELDVEVGKLGMLYRGYERSFNIGELLRLKGVEAEEGYKFLQASTHTSLIKAIERLAELLRKYGKEVLKGENAVFSQLDSLRECECNQYAIDQELKYIRQDVEQAWREKNYRKVVDLYGRVESQIKPSEKKKLEYARKQISN